MMKIRTYSELIKLPTFEERFRYLKLSGTVGVSTFGFDRIFNQMFYSSKEWKHVRNEVIVRDGGCDLGIKDFEIHGRILIHHMNPIDISDVRDASEYLLNPEYLIATSLNTHDAIHYGDEDLLPKDPIIRTRHDTCPWRK